MSTPHNVVDVYVGARLRMRRVTLSMSQTRLGELLGVTFQQIQKYEKGTNRISASRLKLAAEVLQVSVDFFYEGGPAQPTKGGLNEISPAYVTEFLSTSEGFQLNRAFARIRDPKVRRRIVELVVSLAPPDDDGAGAATVR